MEKLDVVAKFGAELRHHRRRSGLSQDALAARLKVSQGQISKLELGLRKPPFDLCGALDNALGLPGHFITLYDRWFETRRKADEWFLSYLDLELKASVIRQYDLAVVPGLFQTEAYARYVIGRGIIPPNEVDDRVRTRMARRVILERDEPPALYFLFDEGVLHRPIGGAVVMREQMEYLLEVGRHTPVSLQVVPYGAGTTTGLTSGFAIADVSDGTYVSIEAAGSSTVSSDPQLIAQSIARYEKLRSEALNRAQSARLIEESMERWS
ncbi:helix-turn-helix domain-containing protein [Sphaerisporangium fuscum]|uniref:helix-turn-helix domain-containing protein n=1 Tax=Sphaerisporangium fuscum TaxID=2835868 RepID=UPI001BDCB75E|nr:helix-turn-helix transcriptional regulator [Sphaerisporangium fuscum]